MNFNYCPNCGHKLTYMALTSDPPIPVVKCGKCGWSMVEGRGQGPYWYTATDSSGDTQINWQAQGSTTRGER